MQIAALAFVLACTGCSFFMHSTPKEPCPSMIAPIIDSAAVATIATSTIVYYDRASTPLARGVLGLGGALLVLPYAIALTYGWVRIAGCSSQT